jgi:hypothetical protein
MARKKRKTAKRRKSARRPVMLAQKVAGLSARVSHLEANPILKKGERARAIKHLREMENEVY